MNRNACTTSLHIRIGQAAKKCSSMESQLIRNFAKQSPSRKKKGSWRPRSNRWFYILPILSTEVIACEEIFQARIRISYRPSNIEGKKGKI